MSDGERLPVAADAASPFLAATSGPACGTDRVNLRPADALTRLGAPPLLLPADAVLLLHSQA